MMAVPGWAASSGEAVVRDAINSMQALSATTGHPQAQRKLLDSIDNALALDLLAKQALGAQWNKMSAAEHRRFIAVFTEALEKLAFPRAAAALSQFKVSYLGADGTASTELVRTTISNGDGGKVPLDFNLERRGTRWQIVDVSMDGGSLSKVVSTRIQNAVQEEGYQKLLEDLQKQVALSDAHS
jgi:phospholipid transport system substrate-binding protein